MDIPDIEINYKKTESFVAPTPFNTPINAPNFPSSQRPSLPTMPEDQTLTRETSSQVVNNLTNNDTLISDQEIHSSAAERAYFYIQSLPEEIQTRIIGLKGIQIRHSELEAKFNQEVFELEKKYLELYRPLFEERYNVTNGFQEPNEKDIEAGKILREEEEFIESQPIPLSKPESPVLGIPEFWLTALNNHPGVSELIIPSDEEALNSLIDVSYRFVDELGYALDFVFSPNNFFTNTVLTKKYFYTQSPDFGEFVLERSEGTEINWKEGKNLTKEIIQKKQIHKVTQETRIVTKETSINSFFTFFTPITLPSNEANLTEEEEKAFQSAMEADYELGEELKNKIIPHAIDWFTGKALEFDSCEEYFDSE